MINRGYIASYIIDMRLLVIVKCDKHVHTNLDVGALNKLIPSYLEVDAVDQVQYHGLIWFDLFHPQSVQLPICRNIKVRKTSFGIFWNIKTKRGSCIVITN
jgi:hypothetical protein